MNDLLSLLGVAALAFVATNVDNLVLLFAFLADRSYRAWHVILGYALGMLGILGLSWLFAWLAHFFRPEYVGFLGVVPILIGLKRFYDEFVVHKGISEYPPTPTSTHAQVITVALADVAHGPDTIVIYSTLLADSDPVGQFAVTVVYLLLVLGWCSSGLLLFRHPRVHEPLQRYGHRFAPFALIGVGIYIVLDTIHDLNAS